LSAIIKKAIIIEEDTLGYTNERDRAARFFTGELVKIPDHLMQSYLGHMSGVGIIVSKWTEDLDNPITRIEVLWPDNGGRILNMVPSYLEHVTEIAL